MPKETPKCGVFLYLYWCPPVRPVRFYSLPSFVFFFPLKKKKNFHSEQKHLAKKSQVLVQPAGWNLFSACTSVDTMNTYRRQECTLQHLPDLMAAGSRGFWVWPKWLQHEEACEVQCSVSMPASSSVTLTSWKMLPLEVMSKGKNSKSIRIHSSNYKRVHNYLKSHQLHWWSTFCSLYIIMYKYLLKW